ncbi:MAG: hypothetical protein AUF79_07720 [Crenarchaeota archaeon 13_1_20CM_2_51_8]|nr:MAG: hypothetical protein AUF79_07720 [Crenarchaeota archaeon 13_1_20CM_2_51_8]
MTAIIVLTTVLAIPLTFHPAAAANGPAVDDPANIWQPQGPYAPGQTGLTSRALLRYYGDPTSEFNDFVAGQLDVTDWPQTVANYGSYVANPDFQLTPTQGQFGDFGIYFNAADNVFTSTAGYAAAGLDAADSGGPFWGACDWNTGAVGTTARSTYSTACGIQMRQGLLHLVDRPAFATSVLNGAAQALADPSPPAKDPAASTHQEQCSWDTLAGTTTATGHTYPSNCISAYNFVNDPTGFAGPGSLDFCAAADHMINAGLATGMNSNCTLTGFLTFNPAAHPMKGMIRDNDPRRLALGNGFMGGINAMFGAGSVVPTYGSIDTLGPIVFFMYPQGQTADWSFYTFGYGLGGPFPDHMYDLYAAADAGSYCGGEAVDEPDNPTMVCQGTQTITTPNPNLSAPPYPCTYTFGVSNGCSFDQDLLGASLTADIPTFRAATQASFHEYGKRAIDIATYSIGIRIAALTAVKGLVNLRGTSYPNVATIAAGHKDPSYTPNNPGLYSFGGNDPSTIRYGQSQAITQLNIFRISTVWEFQTDGLIYDTLFSASPVELTKVFCNMCNVDSALGFNGPTPTIDASGNAHFRVELRNNLVWQDGVPIDASDVAFSLLGLRDYAPTSGGALKGFLDHVTVFNSRQLDAVFIGNSISYPIDMEAIIVPRHIWECTVDNSCAASANADPAKHAQYLAAGVLEPSINRRVTGYDPMAAGTLIGSGPFVCVALTGADQGTAGKGCATNATGARYDHQNIPIGGTLLLQSYDFVKNAGETRQFYQYMRNIDANWGTGSGNAASTHSGQYNEFVWADQTLDAQVDISDASNLAVCFGAVSAATAPALCAAQAGNGYNHWHINAFESTAGTIGLGEVATLQAHFGENYVAPFAWTPSSLENVISYP